MGCKQVFTMLLEASDGADPTSFRKTELFKKCQEMGIIPRSEDELEPYARTQEHPEPYPSLNKNLPNAKDQREISNAESLRLHLVVHDMWCPACAWVIEEALRRSGGVLTASCNFSTDRVLCEYDPTRTSPSRIVRTIDALGYKASMPGQDEESQEKKKDLIRFALSAFLTLNVMMLSFALYSGFFTELSQDTIQKLSFPIFIMASIVLFHGGRKIYQRAWAGIRSTAFGMETLITAGAFTAYLYSTVNFFYGSIHLYFDTASMLITLTLLGKALEGRAKGEVQESLKNFFSLRPTKVRICSEQHPDGRYVDARHLGKGDTFRVEEGGIIPADGLLVEGKGSLDESSLTGEAQPVKKRPGDRVKSGAKVIQGMIKVKAEAVGPESILGQMITIMESALAGRTSQEGKTDRALQWFVPIILLLAVGTGFLCLLFGLSTDQATIRAVTVMVIACPCTLGIAIPMARVAGISVAGKGGLLVRDFSCFERAEQVNAFVLDKTGTVTTGRWSLLEIIPFEPFTGEEVLALAAGLERDSDHYIGMEIRRRAEARRIRPVPMGKINTFENGISGQVGRDEVRIGSRAFLARESEAQEHISVQRFADEQEHSTVFMGFGGRLCAIFVFGDEIREGASVTMRALEAMGYKTFLISGDDEKTTKEVAAKIGIEEAYGGKLPQEKVAFVTGLQRERFKVAMVGDGINDAPALAQAELAIAVHSGGHLGEETTDITLMRGDLKQIIDFIGLAKRVNKKIHQNLVYSFFYNVISIPVAMSGLLTPLIAVSAMLLSSLSVIGNSLLLIKKASESS